MKFNVGQVVEVEYFAFTNKYGGTGISRSKFGGSVSEPELNKTVRVIVCKEWIDDETGQGGWALPDQNDKELMEYLEANAKTGKPSYNRETYETSYDDDPAYVLFISEFDVVDVAGMTKNAEEVFERFVE